jgi:hypothetical protein
MRETHLLLGLLEEANLGQWIQGPKGADVFILSSENGKNSVPKCCILAICNSARWTESANLAVLIVIRRGQNTLY